MPESDYYQNSEGVEFPIEIKWWAGLIIAPIMPICMFLATITDPAFKESGFAGLVIAIFVALGVVIVAVSFLLKNVKKRFYVDNLGQSLVYEVFWGNIRMVRRDYKLEAIDKFEVLIRIVPKGRYSNQRIVSVALIFQSNKKKYLTGPNDQENVRGIASELNMLLQDRAGFPSERFTGTLTPNEPELSPQNLKTQKILIISALLVFVATMVTIAVVLVNIE